MAMVQNQQYHFGVGAPPVLEPILVGIGILTHGHMFLAGSAMVLCLRPGPAGFVVAITAAGAAYQLISASAKLGPQVVTFLTPFLGGGFPY